jgi:hypothetical protein
MRSFLDGLLISLSISLEDFPFYLCFSRVLSIALLFFFYFNFLFLFLKNFLHTFLFYSLYSVRTLENLFLSFGGGLRPPSELLSR